jgi:hypothetical protein
MLSPWEHDESAWLWILSLTDVLHLCFSAISCLGLEHNSTSVHQLLLDEAVLVRSPAELDWSGDSSSYYFDVQRARSSLLLLHL